ncbi:hypothetical protein NQ314_013188 [Rhamnusium bicolor]|uniref:CCHC-type domain-containing protein n=1 Tax=Rhamnusium bicolor TaxID=1586634 RepID=A0AAV8X8C9_9CUCU|nr:hypothetical protein NQ314_013188 [Rhamnusium bicolor]
MLQVTMAGDFILAIASMMIAKLRNNDVTSVLSQVLTDLIQGEFMQLGSKETENERFAHYLTKTYRKTASLIANSLKSVTLLAGVDEHLSDISYQYGRNLGLAFQLVDDLLDFVSSSEAMGKPTAADLRLGLATAPVLFACEKEYGTSTGKIRKKAGYGQSQKCGSRNYPPGKCPAVRWRCYICSKFGHVTRLCPSKENKAVGAVEEQEEAVCEEVNSDLFKLNKVNVPEAYSHKVVLKLNNKMVTFEVDIGACMSVMSIHRYQEILKVPLTNVKCKLVDVLGQDIRRKGMSDFVFYFRLTVNKALNIDQYPLPKLDDIFCKFSG